MKKVINFSVIFIILSLLVGCSYKSKSVEVASTEGNGIKVQLTTDHFIFYCSNEDKRCLEDLSKALESNYGRITKDLGASLGGKVKVYIYQDLEKFHTAINWLDAPKWVVGVASDYDCIQMVSPLNSGGHHNYSEFMKIIVHEFTHIAVGSVNNNVSSIPRWLNEGIAVFEAGQEPEKATIKMKLKEGDYPALSDFETQDPVIFGNKSGYVYSYTIVQYIIESYGYDKLIGLIKSPTDFERILGISKDAFQEKWIAYLNNKYK